MKPCYICGRPVILRAIKITFNRHHGITHWIEHADGSSIHGEKWNCSMMKPYPKNNEDKDWYKMLRMWEGVK